MRELGVVVLVVLLTAAIVVVAARVRESRSVTARSVPPSPGATLADAGSSDVLDDTIDRPLPSTVAGATIADSPGAGPAGEGDAENFAALSVIDVADRVYGGELTRAAGLDLVRAIADDLPQGPHRGGPPLTLTDVLGEVLHDLGDVVDLARVEEPVAAHVALVARRHDAAARAELADQGVESLYASVLALFAAWAGQGGPGPSSV